MKKQLSKSEIKALNVTIEELYGAEPFNKKDTLELHDNVFLVHNKRAIYFYREGQILPTLRTLLTQDLLPKVVVDMGAVRFVTKGADIMRPGIVSIDDRVRKDHVVVIVDETHHKPLGIGIAMYDAEEMKDMESGKVVQSLHYVGDDIWNFTP